MSFNKAMLVCAAMAVSALSACAQPMNFQAALAGTQENPPTSSAGTGTLTGKLFPDTHAFTYTLAYSGLTGPASAAHIHGPAAVGANAGVIAPLASPDSGSSGTVTLTEDQQAALVAGKTYANVHTKANPGGEIRGQITQVP